MSEPGTVAKLRQLLVRAVERNQPWVEDDLHSVATCNQLFAPLGFLGFEVKPNLWRYVAMTQRSPFRVEALSSLAVSF